MFFDAVFNHSFFDSYDKQNSKIFLFGENEQVEKVLAERNIVFSKATRKTVKEHISEKFDKLYCLYDTLSDSDKKEICSMFKDSDIYFFDYMNNIDFIDNFWTKKSYTPINNKKKIKLNIVCSDSGWIFKKFADKMSFWLKKLDVDVTVSNEPRSDVDINHHIPYVAWKPFVNDTLMITHVDCSKKVDLLKKQLKIAGLGICMSKETVEKLTSLGVPRCKLCYINPAHDNVIKPKKYVVGITHRNHIEDFRKNDSAIIDILDGINPAYFKFLIMGDNWDCIVRELRRKGFEIEYYPKFDYGKYVLLMQNIDYYYYSGFDEGSMGFLDAMAAGAGMIITPQGYHLDTNCQIEYPCKTIQQFTEAFLDLQKKKQVKVNAIKDWTWQNYAKKHLECWEFLLRRKPLKDLYKNQLLYEDGFFSMQIEDNR